MRVHYWTADRHGSGAYRGLLPSTALGWLGHQVTVSDNRPEAGWDGVEAVVGCRVALPGPSARWRQLHEQGVRLVMDLDDDYFHLDPAASHLKAVQAWSDPARMARLVDNIKLADTVTCCSDRLADVLTAYHDDVRVVPNGLPAVYLGAPRDYDPAEVIVGWAGTDYTLLELPLAARALRRIANYERPGGVQVRLVGISPQQAVANGVHGERVGTVGWVDDFGVYLQAVGAFDVWVAPYRDTAFNAAKAPTKAIEAGFLGVPIVASAIEPYRKAVVHGETGFLVEPGQEHLFSRYIRTLVDDPGLRQRMGEAARDWASQFIMQALNQQWEKVLQP